MSKRSKALARFRNNPKNVRFEELINLLESFGFIKRQSGTSHAVLKHPDLPNLITVPFHTPFLKQVYVKQAIQFIDDLLLTEEDTEDE